MEDVCYQFSVRIEETLLPQAGVGKKTLREIDFENLFFKSEERFFRRILFSVSREKNHQKGNPCRSLATSSDQSFVNLHSDQNHISISTDTNQESVTKTPAGNKETTASIQPPSFKYLPYKK